MSDKINAIFEGLGAVLLLMNVRKLSKDKKLNGVELLPTVWFNVWGGWNLYYYHSIGQTASWIAGMAVFAVNSIWVCLAMGYSSKKW